VTRPPRLDDDVVAQWLREHPKWRRHDAHLVREFATVDYPSAARVVAEQVELAERLDHHPIVTVGYREVRVELWTHDRGGLTQLDLDYATAFDELLVRRFATEIIG
jgi:4a-hydroxytetrahydrobiopterin dehydratase